MTSRRKIEISILGQTYTLLNDSDEEVMELADMVDRRMREALDAGNARSPEKAAVLAALNIAGELYSARKKLELLTQEVETRSRTLLDELSLAGC